MANKTISNTFVVNTVEDGESAPYYFQEWFAWSNDSATASVTTPPVIAGSWATSIPAQGSYAYLWRKSIRYVWNENTRQYSAETAQYFRMSGTNGTSIEIKGTIKTAITASGTFPTAGFSSGDLGIKQTDSYMWQFSGSSWSHVSSASSDGDSYTMTNDCTIDLEGDGTPENIKGHLIQWSTEASKWLDLGQFKGESGVTYYTHIAWATNVTISGSTVTVTGFVTTKSPNDTTHIWMGTYVDTNSGQDSANASLYTWSNTKGVQGNAGKDAQYIYLKGTAFNKDSGGTNVAASEIKVNGGNNLATQSRGLCLVTLNRQTLAVVDGATIYDTYEGTTGKNNLITKLNSLGDNVFVCLVSYDAIGWSDTLISLLQTFGMSDLPYTSANRYPFLFIGYKNLGKGNGITRMNDMAEPAIPVELAVYVANGALSVKDGDTVQAQYAPNDNPTSSQIHTTWQNGDLYMRTRQSYETTWSSWHKIVGENGDETDYQFALSANLVTQDGTSSTAPSDISSSDWKDAPMATTTQKPYLWSKVQKKDGNGNNVGNPSYIRLTGEKGENAFVVDLENEMTNVALDENGYLIADFDTYFKVRAYYGTTNVLSDSACSVSASCSDPDVTLSTTYAKTTGIRVQITEDTEMADTTEISVTVTHTTYGTRTVVFTLAGVRGGKNAVLQELLPSLDAISFARQADGSLTPSSRDLLLSIKKTQGGSTSAQSISNSGLTIRWSSTSMPASKTFGNEWGSGTATGISWNSITMQIANTVAATNIYIAAFNSAGTLVDGETIPIIKDGNNGDDGVSYCFVFTKAAARVDENNIVTAELAGYAYKYVGGVRSALTSTTIRFGYILTDSDTYATTTTNISGFFDAETWFDGDDIAVYGKNSPSIFAAIVIDGTVVHVETITISVKGRTGSRGKIGRFFYFAGVFDQNDESQTFIVNDAQAPYFEHTETVTTQSGTTTVKRYHVFNYDTNGTYTMKQMWAIRNNWNSAPWEVMTNDFKYLITEALFSAYAHLGSFIINGDWMISQHGTINGNASTSYTNFNNAHPNDNIGNNFIPKLAIDGLTGKVYLNDADIIGKITATSGEFRGKIVTTDITVTGGQFSNIVAQGGTFNNITAQGGTFADISVTGIIRTPFQKINTQALNFDNKNGYYAITGNVTQIGFQQELEYEGMEMTILNMTDPNSLLTIVRVFVDDEEDLDNSFFYKGTKVRYVRLSKGHHITIKAIRRKMIFPNSTYDNCIWVIMNDSEFDLGTFGYGTYNKAAISKT